MLESLAVEHPIEPIFQTVSTSKERYPHAEFVFREARLFASS